MQGGIDASSLDAGAPLAGPPAAAWTTRSVTTLGLLTLGGMYSHLDRALLGFVLPQIKQEMQLSDTVLGLMSGAAFTLFYSSLTVPAAWFADRTSRKRVIAAGFAFWSLITVLTGFAVNAAQLFVCRMLLGAGEATNIGPSKSIVADLFSRADRPIAMAITSAAMTFSGILLVPSAAWIAERHGWRAAFLAAGATGLAVAVFLGLLVKEPRHGEADPGGTTGGQPAIGEALRRLIRSKTYVALAVGTGFMTTAVYMTSTWEASFLARVHGLTVSQAALVLGPGRGTMGLVGLALGALAARAIGGGEARRAMILPFGALCLAISEAIFLLARHPALWGAGVAVSGIFMTFHLGMLYSLLSVVVAPRLRGVAVSLFFLLGAVVGQMIGPVVIGVLTDRLNGSLGLESIRYSLLIAVMCILAAALSFFRAARCARKETEPAR